MMNCQQTLIRGQKTLTANESGIDLVERPATASGAFIRIDSLNLSETDVIKLPAIDLDAIKLLDQLRTAELKQLLQQLSQPLDTPIDDLSQAIPM